MCSHPEIKSKIFSNINLSQDFSVILVIRYMCVSTPACVIQVQMDMYIPIVCCNTWVNNLRYKFVLPLLQ